MSDPRNAAHAKKVAQEKKHQAAPSPSAPPVETPDASVNEAAPAPAAPPATLEGSLVVLAQLKDLEFHSRAHLERLAALQMTVEDELKQKDLAAPLADVFAAQSTFQTRLTTLLDLYKAECERLQGSGV